HRLCLRPPPRDSTRGGFGVARAVQREVHEQHRSLPAYCPAAAAEGIADALVLHAEEFKTKDGHHQGDLVANDPLHPTGPAERLRRRTPEKQDVDVRVLVQVVWMRVVRIVVVTPPGAAYAHQQIAQEEAGNDICAASADDLLMRA